MSLFDWVKGSPNADEALWQLEQALAAEAGRLWLPIYANESRIQDVFVQRAPNVVEIGTGREFTLDVGGGFMSLASLKGGAKTVSNQKVAITPLIQTLILKEAALDLATHQASAVDTLLHYVGSGRVVIPGQTVGASPEYGLSQDLAENVQSERESQEKMIRLRDPASAGTIVWLAQALTSLACICSFSETTGTLPSALTGTYGVLGVYERSLVAGDGSSATLLTPLMIWLHAGG